MGLADSNVDWRADEQDQQADADVNTVGEVMQVLWSDVGPSVPFSEKH